MAGLWKFHSGLVSGTSRNYIQIATDVVAALPLGECSFSVIHIYQGRRLVTGYIYADKTYGTIIISMYEGYTVTIDLAAGEYKER